MNYYENIVVFDKYKLVHPIGDNPFYSDYLGQDIETGDNVYVKMINPETILKPATSNIKMMITTTFISNRSSQAKIAGFCSRSVCT